jgi:hypothetical protein
MKAPKPYLSQLHFGDNVTASEIRATVCAGLTLMLTPIPSSPEVIVHTLTPILTSMKAWMATLPQDFRLVTMSIVLSVVLEAAKTWMAQAFSVEDDDIVLKVFKAQFCITKAGLSLYKANHAFIVRLHDDIVRGDEWPWMMPAHIEALSVAKFRDMSVDAKLDWLRRLRGRCASAKNVKWCKTQTDVKPGRTSPSDSALMVTDNLPYTGTASQGITAHLNAALAVVSLKTVQEARAAIQCMPPNDRLVATGILVDILKATLSTESILQLEDKLVDVGKLDAIQIGIYASHKDLLVHVHDKILERALPAWMMPKSIKALSASGLRYQTLPVKVEVLRRLDGKKAVLANVQESMTRMMDGPLWESPRKWTH